MGSEKEAAVTKVTVKIGETEISLSPKQLKDLREALDDLFPVKWDYYPTEYCDISRQFLKDMAESTGGSYTDITGN